MKPRTGYCEFCGSRIPRERLEIIPETTTCVRCSQARHYTEVEILGARNLAEEDLRLNMEDFEYDDFSTSFDSE